MAISSRLTINGESLIVLLRFPGSCGVAECRFDLVFNFQVLVKEKASVVNTEALLLMAPRPGLEPGTYGLTDDSVIEEVISSLARVVQLWTLGVLWTGSR